MFKLLGDAWDRRFITSNYVWANLRNKYKGSILGYLWSVAFPLLRYSLMAFVFVTVLGRSDSEYIGRLVIGLVCFQYFASAVGLSTQSFLANANYIRKIYVPKLTFVLNTQLLEFVNFLIVLVSTLALSLALGLAQWSPMLLLLPYVLFLFFLFATGLGTLLAVSMVWFRDTQYLTEIFLQTVLFVTPVFFPPELLPSWMVVFNPVYYFIHPFQEMVVVGAFPELVPSLVVVVLAIGTFLLGLFVLNQAKDEIYYRL